MRVHFWGTRGSLPVALTAPDVRAKLVRALSQAAGTDLSSPAAINAFVDTLGGEGRQHFACVGLPPVLAARLAGLDRPYPVCDSATAREPHRGQQVVCVPPSRYSTRKASAVHSSRPQTSHAA